GRNSSPSPRKHLGSRPNLRSPRKKTNSNSSMAQGEKSKRNPKRARMDSTKNAGPERKNGSLSRKRKTNNIKTVPAPLSVTGERNNSRVETMDMGRVMGNGKLLS